MICSRNTHDCREVVELVVKQSIQNCLGKNIHIFMLDDIFYLYKDILSMDIPNIGINVAFDLINKGLTEAVKATAPKIRLADQKGPDFQQMSQKIREDTQRAKKDAGELDRSIEAYFIGPRAENIDYFSQLIQKAINNQRAARIEYEMEDARHITRRMKNQPSFLDAHDRLDRAFNTILTKLKDLSPPFYSSRYYGHMNWQTTIPAIVGNFATLLYNPNNCAFEGGPYTTLLEIQVITEFAKMFQYPPMLSFSEGNSDADYSWGHLTCGGTVANCQAFWAARNCRFLSISIRKYIKTLGNKNDIESIEVNLVEGGKKKLVDLNAWEIMNISNDETMKLYTRAFKQLYPDESEEGYSAYQNGVAKFSVGKVGVMEIYEDLADINDEKPVAEWVGLKRLPKPKIFVSATAHYSIPKSLSILGLGEQAVEKVIVDLDSRVDIQALRQKLENCWVKKIPVLGVVGIVGTTEQSTVDDLTKIVKLKEEYGQKGLYFHFHIDGAYGGYFVSMLREKGTRWNSFSQYVDDQLSVFKLSDSITFDPHKTGYVPYTCGGIIYRNHRLRDNLSFSAPYIYTGSEPNMSIYGVEGSKPGSAVTSVYLSLQVLPLVRAGHGELLERTMMNTKIFTACLYRIKEVDVEYLYGNNQKLTERFDCFVLPRLNCEKENKPELREEELKAIATISETNPSQLQSLVTGSNDVNLQNVYYNLGPDLNIVCYGLNFIDKETNKFNTSLKKYNEFNRTLIKLSKPVGTDVSVRMKDLFVSETEIRPATYGKAIFDDYLKRHNLVADDEDIVFIRSTIMNAFFTELGADPTARVQSSNRLFVREIVENGCETLLHLKWR